MSMVKINRNSVQSTATFYADTCKMNLCFLHLLEWGKLIGMSYRKLVDYQFPLLKIRICFRGVMRM